MATSRDEKGWGELLVRDEFMARQGNKQNLKMERKKDGWEEEEEGERRRVQLVARLYRDVSPRDVIGPKTGAAEAGGRFRFQGGVYL